MASDNTVLSARVLELVKQKGWKLATAESLTAGLLSATICDVAGASDAFAGGVTTYQTPTKHSVLGVSNSRLEQTGPVDTVVAEQMAQGVVDLFGADVGVSTTGVAGPGSADGKPEGTVFVSVITPEVSATEGFQFSGDRQQIRQQTVKEALQLLIAAIAA